MTFWTQNLGHPAGAGLLKAKGLIKSSSPVFLSGLFTDEIRQTLQIAPSRRSHCPYCMRSMRMRMPCETRTPTAASCAFWIDALEYCISLVTGIANVRRSSCTCTKFLELIKSSGEAARYCPPKSPRRAESDPRRGRLASIFD
jgi:hypothetical protein